MLLSSSLLLISSLSLTQAVVHNLFVGNLGGPSRIYALEFDDETNNLTMARNITADLSHPWITFDHDKKNIYGVSVAGTRISSYEVTGPTSLNFTKSINATGDCFNRTSAFIIASPVEPYYVFTAAWPGPQGCAMSLSIDETGTLKDVADSWFYENASAVHGMALSQRGDQQLLYSADWGEDTLWTHRIDNATGNVQEVGSLTMPTAGIHPRHLTVHPNGTYVYVVMEAGNELVQFSLGEKYGNAVEDTASYSLIPTSANTSLYWSAEVMLSPSARYLWATSRAEYNTNITGQISCFLLGDDGAILKKMFMVPTTTINGIANAIQPAFWSDEYAAMADYGTGYVQVWKLGGRNETALGTEYDTATPIAQVNITDGGCCANAIWYS